MWSGVICMLGETGLLRVLSVEIEQKAKEIDMKMHRVWKCDCCGADFGDKEECQKHEDGCWEKKYAGWAERKELRKEHGTLQGRRSV